MISGGGIQLYNNIILFFHKSRNKKRGGVPGKKSTDPSLLKKLLDSKFMWMANSMSHASSPAPTYGGSQALVVGRLVGGSNLLWITCWRTRLLLLAAAVAPVDQPCKQEEQQEGAQHNQDDNPGRQTSSSTAAAATILRSVAVFGSV